MRKVLLILLLVLTFTFPVSALDGTVVHQGYDSSGSLHQIVKVGELEGYYYIDDEKQVGSGLIFVAGNYYFVRTSGVLAYGDYSVSESKANGLLPAGHYQFSSDNNFILASPPYYPDNWESAWFDYDPTETPETEPSVPEETVDPDALPTVPPDQPISPNPDYTLSIIAFCAQIISVPAGWMLSIFGGSGMVGMFLAAFMVYQVTRILLGPVLGQSGSDTAKRSRDKEE